MKKVLIVLSIFILTIVGTMVAVDTAQAQSNLGRQFLDPGTNPPPPPPEDSGNCGFYLLKFVVNPNGC